MTTTKITFDTVLHGKRTWEVDHEGDILKPGTYKARLLKDNPPGYQTGRLNLTAVDLKVGKIETTNMKEETKQPKETRNYAGNPVINFETGGTQPPENLHRKSVLETIRFAPQTISEDDYLKICSGWEAHTNFLVKKLESLAILLVEAHGAILSDQKIITDLQTLLDSCRDTVKRQAEMLQEVDKTLTEACEIRNEQARAISKLTRQVKAYKGIANKLKKK